VATFFYLRIILTTYSADEEDQEAAPADEAGAGGVGTAVRTATGLQVPVTAGLAVLASVAFTIAFGLAPGPIIHFATKATLIF
jgi:NADH:ubiquinone oxidoreductase subunit 2 (subunit N)